MKIKLKNTPEQVELMKHCLAGDRESIIAFSAFMVPVAEKLFGVKDPHWADFEFMDEGYSIDLVHNKIYLHYGTLIDSDAKTFKENYE
jgi:hypothetical protein